jgi:predicted DNA-binding protein (MmcQ/YjbR family)
MNKLHWISVILADAAPDTIATLTNVSYEATHAPKKSKRHSSR